MDKSEKDKLNKALKKYFGEIHEIYAGGNYSEGSFYDCLKHFIKDSGRILGYSTFPFVLPKRTEVGIPDFFVRKNGEIIGHIERKTEIGRLLHAAACGFLHRAKHSRDFEGGFW